MRPGDADAKARARARVMLFARLNLVLVAARHVRHGGGGASLLTWPAARTRRRSTDAAVGARAGEPDRYLAALLAPPAAREACWRWRRFRRARRACRRSSCASRPWARSACSGGAMRWSRPSRHTHRQSRSRRRCARPAPDHDCRLPLLLGVIDAPMPRPRCTTRRRDEAALRDLLWKSEGALFALAARMLWACAAEFRCACKLRCRRPGLWAGAPAARPCPRRCSRGRVPLPQSRSWMQPACPQRTCSRRLAAVKIAALLRRLCAEVRRNLRRGAATRGQFAAAVPGRRSFLWPWSSLICGLSNGRAATLLREASRDCAADARVQDCRCALAWPTVSARRVGAGGHAARRAGLMRIDACRRICLALMLVALHGAIGGSRAADRLAGREPLPFLPRPRRHRGASRDLGEPVGRPSARARCWRPSACWPSAMRTGGAPPCSPRPAGTRTRNRYACREQRRLHQSQEPYGPGAAWRVWTTRKPSTAPG